MLPGHLGSICNRGTDVFCCELRIFCKDLVETHSSRQIIKDKRNPYACSANNRFTKADPGID